jgi:shikimate dehydrogenase
MRTFGLIGYPLSHSFSKKFFTEKFRNEEIPDCQYELFPLEQVEALTTLLANTADLHGLNVTIPYKLEVMPFLDEIEDAAAKIGAVNCISIKEKQGAQWLKGYNTDAFGFKESLVPLLKTHHSKALILGNGGASKAVKYVLNEINIPFQVVVRTPADGCVLYSEITPELLASHTLIINTTPLGMYPNVDQCPELPYQHLTSQHLAYDLVYNPEETTFLKKAQQMGAAVKNGMEMLYLQAERSWQIWNT